MRQVESLGLVPVHLYHVAKEGVAPPAQRFGRSVPPARVTAEGFPGGAVVKNPPANAGDTGLSPDPGRSQVPRSS